MADTNFLINVHEGHEKVEPFLDGAVVISVVSEIELLGWHKISSNEKQKLQNLLSDCFIYELTSDIRKIAIEIRQNVKIKTPDTIIAATAKHLQLPLVTSDKGFRNLPDIELILI